MLLLKASIKITLYSSLYCLKVDNELKRLIFSKLRPLFTMILSLCNVENKMGCQDYPFVLLV